ncbi:MAG TPA: hypothetical protein VL359_04520, partial [bacterium]|nr:hypothetical protein [bacterium]
PYLPAAGGDSISVELTLQEGDKRWVLRRRWGTGATSELQLPAGGSLSDEDVITAKIASLLPAGRAATATLLMTGQSALAETLATLKDARKGGESLADLADILRRAVLSTGGVSVDRFTARVAEMRARAWSRWDRASGGPEGGRGADRPWKQNVGTVLAAWYAREDARAAWKKAEAHDAAVDEVNRQLRAAAASAAEPAAFVRVHADAARDARARKAWEADLRAAQAEARDMVSVSREWPVAESRARELAEAAATAAPRLQALQKEAAEAQKAEEARAAREKAQRVQRARAARDAAAARLQALPRLDRKDVEAIRAAAGAVDRAEARLEACRLSVTVTGRKAVEIRVQEDSAAEKTRSVLPGAAASFTVAGRLRLVHPDMEVEVRSGNTAAGAALEAATAARGALAALLERHGCASIEEAEEHARATETSAAELRSADRALQEELEGETVADFERRLALLAPAADNRPAAVVKVDVAELQGRIEADARERAGLMRRLEEWTARYDNLEALILRLAATKGKEEKVQALIAGAAPLPQGYADVDAFLKAFEEALAAAAHRAGDLRVLEERRRNLEESAPAQSAEELQVQAAEAEETFQDVVRRAGALDRIAAHSAALLNASNAAVYKGMTARLARWLSLMTDGRYEAPVMEGPLPVGLPGAPGKAVAWDHLSGGTRDTLALALRLAMAEAALGDADGFLLLDDPLVEMDP